MIEGAKEAYLRDLKSVYGYMISENVTDIWHPKNTFMHRAGPAGEEMFCQKLTNVVFLDVSNHYLQ